MGEEGLPDSSVVKNQARGSVVKNPPAVQELQEMWAWSLGQKDPLAKDTATHSSILAWRTQRQSSLVGYSSEGHKEWEITEEVEHNGWRILEQLK